MSTHPRHDETVLAMLIKACEMGDECPSNYVLSAACGFSAPNTVVPVIARLEQRGLIKVVRGSRARKVTIVATGKSTREVISVERQYGRRITKLASFPFNHRTLAQVDADRIEGLRLSAAQEAQAQSLRKDQAEKGQIIAPPEPMPRWGSPDWVSRDPCPKCGVRADIGCKHVRRVA